MEKTTNYQLNQWDKSDRIMMEDFNADNAKIEAALTEACKPPFVIGVLDAYDGTADVTVDLGQQPKMVIVGNRLGLTNIITSSSGSSSCGHAVAMPGYPGYKSAGSSSSGTQVILETTATGFTLSSGLDNTLVPYYYLALL